MGKQARINAAKKKQLLGDNSVQEIELKNPQRVNFGAFVVGNHTHWYEAAMTELAEMRPDIAQSLVDQGVKPGPDFFVAAMRALDEAGTDKYVVEQGAGAGKIVTICGAGPSLAKYADEYCAKSDDVWACNSALTWLIDNGHKVTHAVTVDQTPEMLIEWSSAPDVEYLIASTVHVHLTELLKKRGRKFRFFHNYCGLQGDPVTHDGECLPFEDWLYCALFPSTVRCGSGLNTVNRAMDLALYAGYEKIYVLGMDCAIEVTEPPPKSFVPGSPEHIEWLRLHTIMHANGDSAIHNGQSPITLDGWIDEQFFLTKPDLIISAVWGVKVEQMQKGRVEIIGSRLIDALRGKDDEYLKRLPCLTNNGKALFPDHLESAA